MSAIAFRKYQQKSSLIVTFSKQLSLNKLSVQSMSTLPKNKPTSHRMVVKPMEFLHTDNVKHNPGSLKKPRKFGRGGKGRTGGRGRKGWKARHPNSSRLPGFAGGQTTIMKAFPKFGLQNKKGRSERLLLKPLQLDTLQHWIDQKRIDPTQKITIASLIKAGCISNVRDGITLLATGGQFLSSAINIEVTRASLNAIRLVESKGGSITTVYHNREIIRAMLVPQKYVNVPDLLVPASAQHISRYTDPDRRGYLSHLVADVDKKDMMKKILDTIKEHQKKRLAQ
ncbi:hypothetical protein BDV3_004095 [Batrachochytrium dendrobatidis]|uniref:Ribosomal protein L15 n=2 Tax=Batrachochytrium dendrobatidis TaxID=109871 RepID=A0A177WEM8_BATDL|nr:ribosomal protein L15 [Batrachochytrium dendrobatidis JEL423]